MIDSKTPILVVEDMMSMRKMVVLNLKQMGFETIVEAKDGKEAFAQIESKKVRFGLIVSDWMMPECTGIELLKKVRASAEFSKTPFIMLTAEAVPATIKEAVDAGVDEYMTKPFAKDVFIEKVGNIQKKRAA